MEVPWCHCIPNAAESCRRVTVSTRPRKRCRCVTVSRVPLSDGPGVPLVSVSLYTAGPVTVCEAATVVRALVSLYL